MSWTVVHPIDDKSPLKGMTYEKLKEAQAEIIVTLSGVDNTFFQTIHSRFSYVPEEIVWNRKFQDIIKKDGDGLIAVELDQIHEIV